MYAPRTILRGKERLLMNETSRRRFLITAGAGAAVAAAATAGVARSGGPAAAAAGGAAGAAATLPKGAEGPLVAYVHDVRAGTVAVMVGETEVVVTDHALVSRLLAVRAGRA